MRSVRIGLANPPPILAHAEVSARSSSLVHAVLFTLSSVAHAGLFMLAARSSYHVRKLLNCRC